MGTEAIRSVIMTILTYMSQVRMFVIMYRGGAFDRKLKAVGMEPAVAD